MKKVWFGFLLIAITAIILYSVSLNQLQTKEDEITTELLNNVLYDKYVPSHIEMVNKLTSENQTIGEDNLYGFIWHENSETFYSSIFYNDLNKSGISSLKIFVMSSSVPDSLDEDYSSSLFDRYFKIHIQGNIKCNYTYSNSAIRWCEVFWEGSDNTKMGLVAVTSPNTKFVGFCEYPKGSINYESSTCIQWATE